MCSWLCHLRMCYHGDRKSLLRQPQAAGTSFKNPRPPLFFINSGCYSTDCYTASFSNSISKSEGLWKIIQGLDFHQGTHKIRM